MCNHLFVDGFGGMGDALVCELCGLDKYPEAIRLQLVFARLQGRVVYETAPDYEVHHRAAVAARIRKDNQ